VIVSTLFSLLLVASSAPAPDQTMEVGIPPAVSAPAPNIRLEHFQYVIPGARPDSAVDYDQMLQLQERIKAVAKATLAPSQSTFGVRVIYALTPAKPAEMRMQVAEAPPAEATRIKKFYDKASALKDFHCTRGLVYIMFDYRVSPTTVAHSSTRR
jgi:hypothetical protein